uniref:Peroxisome assembly protein 12 n=1 Tax=Setaria digitata TaxID=48799 RepID=A0A915PDS5_9BILA
MSNKEIMNQMVSAGQPSIFELIAQDGLSTSIQQAVRHIAKYLHESNPSRYRVLWKWYDEIYAAVDLVVESFYLKRYGGSLTENFYGMKRVINGTCKSASTGFPKLRSLFMLVGWPYIMKKLEKFHSLLLTYVGISDSGHIPLIRIIISYYPWLKILFSSWAFLLKIAYLLSLCTAHSPELIFANVHLEKITQVDLMSFGELNKKKSWQVLTILISLLTRCITFGLYFIQFLDFYYNSDTGVNFRMEQRKRNFRYPPAPHKKLRESTILLLDTNKCPLCLQQRTNDTVLAVSGYVFCYGCIYSYVEREKHCPVTSLPANVDDLIKIFVLSP